jgi:methionyl aminopeptidase
VIVPKKPEEIQLMRRAGRVVASVVDAVREKARPGVRTSELDRLAEKVIRSAGCVPSFKGYPSSAKGVPDFPASVCVSLNDEIVHGIPGSRRLAEGDLLKLDVGAIWRGWHADSATTIYVGENPPDLVEKLLRATQEALWSGIGQARAGRRLSDISASVQQTAEGAGFSVVRELVGHGIGRDLHEDPQVPNRGAPGRGPVLRAGMTIAIEPMVNAGDWRTELRPDGWTIVTADGSLSAHFEHTIAIGTGEPEVLTLP